MNKKYLRIVWWSIIGLYLTFIYATLGFASVIWNAVDDALGGNGIFAIYVLCSVVGVFIFGYMLFGKKEKVPDKYFIMLIFVAVYFFMLTIPTRHPSERAHVIEYGLLGVFVYNALKIDFSRFRKNLYIVGMSFCWCVGVVAEISQLFVPGRIFSWKDMVINATSSIIVLLVIRINILKEPPKPFAFQK